MNAEFNNVYLKTVNQNSYFANIILVKTSFNGKQFEIIHTAFPMLICN